MTSDGTHSTRAAARPARAPGSLRPARPTPPVPALVALALLAVGVAFAAGALAQTWVARGGPDSPGVSGGSVAATASGAGPAALAIFERPQDSQDADVRRAATVVGPAFVPASLRELSFRVPPGALLFAARDRAQHVCLVAIIARDSYVSACSTDEEFARTPLQLSFLTPPTFSSFTHGTVVLHVSAQWSPDGASTGAVSSRESSG